MTKGRLEAFSDGVMAIIITIMVLELKTPPGADWADLGKSLGSLFAYALSFTFIAIYWNNHHHMLHACTRVNGATLWANLHLLFWLSLFPFVTGWMGENHFAPTPSAVYGIVLLLAAIAYWILQRTIIAADGPNSKLGEAVGWDWKGKLSPLFYIVAIASTFGTKWVAQAIYVAVALIWLIPDRRIEQRLGHER